MAKKAYGDSRAQEKFGGRGKVETGAAEHKKGPSLMKRKGEPGCREKRLAGDSALQADFANV